MSGASIIPVALTIAGSDPGGGAGIQADLKTFHQLKVFGTSVITLVTVQNTMRVSRVEVLDPDFVGEQMWAVLEDLPPQAAKTGALGSAAVIEAVSRLLANAPRGCPLVVDPVMISKHGAPLLDSGARLALLELLIPKAALVTPNLHEAAALAEMPVGNPAQMKDAARLISAKCGGRVAVLVKGGHLTTREIVDILYHEGDFLEIPKLLIDTRHTHGTGCTYSAAITAFLAHGLPMSEAVRRASAFIDAAIRTAPGLGGGSGPVNHWAAPGDTASL